MSGWAAGEKCLVKDQDHGWATAVVTGSQGIGSQATLKLRLDDGGVLLEKQGSDVERLTNDKTLEETEDMAALENLSEATMLECFEADIGGIGFIVLSEGSSSRSTRSGKLSGCMTMATLVLAPVTMRTC